MNRRALRWLLAVGAGVLLLAATGYLLYPRSALLRPLPVGAHEQEVAWLYPATAPASWNRFVMALARIDDQLAETFPGIKSRIDARTFPVESTAIPEAALEWPDGRRLVFRWYKLTTEQDVNHWVEALVTRSPAPLAILGGNTSDGAYRVLSGLARHAVRLAEAERPVLLLTTGTANRWVPYRSVAGEPEAEPVELFDLYPERTFRFCFSNGQIAQATCDFIWSQPDLRPENDPVYLVSWRDDSYSRDLYEGYTEALQEIRVASAIDDLAWVAAGVGGGGWPPLTGIVPLRRCGGEGFSAAEGRRVRAALDDVAWLVAAASGHGGLPLTGVPPPQRFDASSLLAAPFPNSWQPIESSVGSFTAPNRFEQEQSRSLLRELANNPFQKRALVVVTGQALPCRRFLRAVVRSEPVRGRQLVVTTGDSVSFNYLYRDRISHWPVQDFPFPLVTFAHANPISAAAGFQADDSPEPLEESGVRLASRSGTDDLLLLEDSLRALALSYHNGTPATTPAQLARRLRQLHYADRVERTTVGVPLFDDHGNRATNTGEHLIWLRPKYADERVLPEATLEVYRRAGPSLWERVGSPLTVLYAPPDPTQGGN